jgi:hypothetical protein
MAVQQMACTGVSQFDDRSACHLHTSATWYERMSNSNPGECQDIRIRASHSILCSASTADTCVAKLRLEFVVYGSYWEPPIGTFLLKPSYRGLLFEYEILACTCT